MEIECFIAPIFLGVCFDYLNRPFNGRKANQPFQFFLTGQNFLCGDVFGKGEIYFCICDIAVHINNSKLMILCINSA